MMDEPGAGLSEAESDFLRKVIVGIPDAWGAQVLLVDHDVDLISDTCSTTLVLDFGSKIALGRVQDALKDPKVRAAYLGEVGEGLKIRGLVVARGGKEVIRGVDLDIPPGQITALLGANGAGKSSIVLATVGALPVTSGEVTVDGTSIRGMRPEYVRRLGVAAVPEGHHVLSDLTVADNLKAAGHNLTRAKLDDGVRAALETFPELEAKLGQRAVSLSGGQQQMVVLAQAIVDRPRYLLADELSFGLAPVIVARLVPVITRLAEMGVGILLIEQFTHIALRISHHVSIMERGYIRFSGSPEEVRANPDILHSAYLAA
jgi:branched-chain amino acid transport system ATP-binding protein